MAEHLYTQNVTIYAAEAQGGGVLGQIESSVVVSDGKRRWLEHTGTFRYRGERVVWSARIPIAPGWTMVKLDETPATDPG